MTFTDQIDARATGLARAIDEHADLLAERTPVPIDALVRRIGAVNAEAVRQTGRLSVTAAHAVEGVVRTAWTGASDLWETTGSSVDVVRGSVERNLRIVGRRADDTADVVEDRAERAASTVAKAADTAVAETMATGAAEPDRPYEAWRKGELYERAQQLDIDGRSGMSKADLVRAVRSA
jgi:hypothetical protein